MHRNLAGITPELVAAVTGAQMEFLQLKSTVVVAVPVDAEPGTGGDAEGIPEEEKKAWAQKRKQKRR